MIDKIPKIVFYADRHKYFAKGVDLVSASGLVKCYKDEFDREYWLTSGAIKEVFPDVWRAVKDEHYKGMSRPPKTFFKDVADRLNKDEIAAVNKARKELAYDWEIKNAVASLKGTRFHARMEEMDLAQKGGVVNPVTGKKQKTPLRPCLDYSDNASILDNLEDLSDGYYPELVIFFLGEDVGIAGQVDRAWIWTDKKTGKRYYASDDWKTNWDKKGSKGWGNFNTILGHLRETKTNEYALQGSIYAYMMELAGYTVAHIQITYVKDFDIVETEAEVLPYLREEVESMFDEYFNG